MSCRTLTEDDVEIHLYAIPDDLPVRGNACISGDDALDRQVENEILNRLEADDIWAWATVAVTVSWKGQEATEYLGACSYEDAAAFHKSGYMADMIDAAIDKLNHTTKEIYNELTE